MVIKKIVSCAMGSLILVISASCSLLESAEINQTATFFKNTSPSRPAAAQNLNPSSRETISAAPQSSEASPTKAIPETNYYRLFYGKWEITRVLDYGAFEEEKERGIIDNKVGKTFTYSPKETKGTLCEGYEVEYGIQIFPLTPKQDKFYSPDFLLTKHLGFSGNYFVEITIKPAPGDFDYDNKPYEQLMGDWFVIKDNETLILAEGDGTLLEAKRTEFSHDYRFYNENDGSFFYD